MRLKGAKREEIKEKTHGVEDEEKDESEEDYEEGESED